MHVHVHACACATAHYTPQGCTFSNRVCIILHGGFGYFLEWRGCGLNRSCRTAALRPGGLSILSLACDNSRQVIRLQHACHTLVAYELFLALACGGAPAGWVQQRDCTLMCSLSTWPEGHSDMPYTVSSRDPILSPACVLGVAGLFAQVCRCYSQSVPTGCVGGATRICGVLCHRVGGGRAECFWCDVSISATSNVGDCSVLLPRAHAYAEQYSWAQQCHTAVCTAQSTLCTFMGTYDFTWAFYPACKGCQSRFAVVRVTAGSLCGACLQVNFGASKSRLDWCAHTTWLVYAAAAAGWHCRWWSFLAVVILPTN